jgi:hypothetical protein
MGFEYLYTAILQFLYDPFNRKALASAHKVIAVLEAENAKLRSIAAAVAGPDIESKPELLQPFRVRMSMRDRKAKKEASFNKIYRNIEAIERGDFDVHIQDGEVVREPTIRKGDG